MLDLEGGKMPMEPLYQKNDVFKTAVENLLAETEADNRADMYRYAGAAANAFEDIQSLRSRRVRFDKICKLLETAGLLPQNANVQSLRQAFNREKARRNKTGGHTAQAAKQSGLKEGGIDARVHEKKIPETNPPVISSPRVMNIPNRTAGSKAGLEVKPDNTFTIRPINPDDLPDT